MTAGAPRQARVLAACADVPPIAVAPGFANGSRNSGPPGQSTSHLAAAPGPGPRHELIEKDAPGGLPLQRRRHRVKVDQLVDAGRKAGQEALGHRPRNRESPRRGRQMLSPERLGDGISGDGAHCLTADPVGFSPPHRRRTGRAALQGSAVTVLASPDASKIRCDSGRRHGYALTEPAVMPARK